MKKHTSVMWAPAYRRADMFKKGVNMLRASLPPFHAVAVSVTIKPLTAKQKRETFGP